MNAWEGEGKEKGGWKRNRVDRKSYRRLNGACRLEEGVHDRKCRMVACGRSRRSRPCLDGHVFDVLSRSHAGNLPINSRWVRCVERAGGNDVVDDSKKRSMFSDRANEGDGSTWCVRATETVTACLQAISQRCMWWSDQRGLWKGSIAISKRDGKEHWKDETNVTCWTASKAARRRVGRVGRPDERDVGGRSGRFEKLPAERMGKGRTTGDGRDGARGRREGGRTAFNWRHSELHADGARQEAIAVRWVREDAGAKIPLSRRQLNGVLDCRRKRFEKKRETDSTVEVLTLPCTYSDTANANAIVLPELADETVDTVPWPMTIGVRKMGRLAAYSDGLEGSPGNGAA